MKLTKRLLSMLLVVCLVLSLLPTVALFAGAAPAITYTLSYSKNGAITTADYSSGETISLPSAEKVAAYASTAMMWAWENGILKGENGLLRPEDYATRAQIANIFMRLEKALAFASFM